MRPSRRRVLAVVQTLDPEVDDQRIVQLSGLWDFPWDGARALELALFRTFAVPSIGGLLYRTGEFTQRTQKRYDDTELLIAEFLEHGYDSPRGRTAIERMNTIHQRFRISNEDFLYVLSTFVLEPSRWNARFGWRPISDVERRAGVRFWSQVGQRMGLADVPDTFEAFRDLNESYEREHFRYTAKNAAVARATLELFCSWYLPKPLWPLGVQAVSALLDQPLRDALGIAAPPRALASLVIGALRLRARVLPFWPARRTPKRVTDTPHPTYPHGYVIDELGPSAPTPATELGA